MKLNLGFIKLKFSFKDMTSDFEEFIGFRKGTSLLVFPFFGCGFEMEFFGKKKSFFARFLSFCFLITN